MEGSAAREEDWACLAAWRAEARVAGLLGDMSKCLVQYHHM